VAVHSNQLACTSFSDTSIHSLYTVPTAKRTIVKSIVVQSAAGVVQHITFTIKNSGGTALAIFSVDCAASGATGATQIVLPWIVLSAGQSLSITFGNTGGWVTVSGSELDE
jgi:hypothetical protein